MKYLLCFLFVFTGFVASAQQTYFITGTVSDDKGTTIPGATIFLTNTKKATATDGWGKFTLNELSPGPYEVVVKMLGFTPNVQTVTIDSRSVELTIKLNENNTVLKAVNINGKPDPNRDAYMKLFVNNFIGETPNAAKCELINPGVLAFHKDKKADVLKANADELLIIENKALGYRLKYLLKEFRLQLDYNICYYKGYPYFEELKGTVAQENQWAENRERAYLGSYQHFFRAIMNNTAQQEGFVGFRYQKDWKGKGSPMRYQSFDSLFVSINKKEKELVTKSVINVKHKDTTWAEYYIIYKKPMQPVYFYKTTNNSDFPEMVSVGKQSKIRIYTDTVKVDKELLLNPTKNFTFYGYWGGQRVAEYLPLDYFIDPLAE